jgi:hypothetical protein
VSSDVVKIDKRVYVEKISNNPAASGKVFSSFKLQIAPENGARFPILELDFCAKQSTNRQLGTPGAHREVRAQK